MTGQIYFKSSSGEYIVNRNPTDNTTNSTQTTPQNNLQGTNTVNQVGSNTLNHTNTAPITINRPVFTNVTEITKSPSPTFKFSMMDYLSIEPNVRAESSQPSQP